MEETDKKVNKMFALNASCTVCKVSFTNSDAIYSTSCGHIFHFTCMNQWRFKSTSCPQCRSYNPTNHRIYLNFEDTSEYETVVNDLRAKLQSSNTKIDETKKEVVRKEKKIDELRRLYNISEQWRAELQNKIQKLSHELQVKTVNHAEELTMKLNEIQSLKSRFALVEQAEGVDDLCEKICKLEEDLKLTTARLTAENSRLKENLNVEETSKIILNYKMEMQEQRLKHVTLELKKQIDESINRSMDRIIPVPLQPLKHTKLKENKQHNSNHNTILTEQNSYGVHTLEKARNADIPVNIVKPKISQTRPKSMQHNNRKMADLTKTNKSIKHTELFYLTQPNDCKVIIKDFPLQDLLYPLTNTVIVLASEMSLSLRTEDMKNVSIVEQKNITNNSNKVVLLVEFKTIEGKIQFLLNRMKLKNNSSTKSIQLRECINEDIYPIFMYAKRLLRAHGYEYIVCRDNQVFAKKNRDDIVETAIKNRNDVDRILGRPISQNQLDIC